MQAQEAGAGACMEDMEAMPVLTEAVAIKVAADMAEDATDNQFAPPAEAAKAAGMAAHTGRVIRHPLQQMFF